MIVVSIISVALVLGVSLSGQTSAMEKDIIQHHIVMADIASQSIEAGYLAQRWPFETLKEISRCENVLFWWIVKPDGEILLADDTAMWGKQINDESLGTNKTVVKDSVFLETGENIKLIAHPLDMKEDGKQWTFYLGISLESVANAGNKMIVDGVSSSVAIIIMVIFISAYFTRTITRPVTKLTEGAKAVADGNLGYRITVKSEDELGTLAKNFNKMTMDLEKSRLKLEEYSETLERKVTERTEELQGSKKNLEKTVMDLQKSRYAVLNIMRDLKKTVASREKAEEEVREINKNLEGKVKERTAEVEKLLKQKDEFVNQLGHDLKNPLGPLINLLPILEEDETDHERKEIFDVLNRNVSHMKNLVTKTIQLARLNAPGVKLFFEDTNLLSEVDDVIKKSKLLFEENNIEVENKIGKDIIVKADKLRLTELFDNLIGNSVKYSPDGGKITIDAEKNEDFVTVSIKDTGMGITKEQLNYIFDEFYKADWARHDFDSSGLGMPIAKHIVEKHGGRIWAESQGLGKGTTMFFTILPSSKD